MIIVATMSSETSTTSLPTGQDSSDQLLTTNDDTTIDISQLLSTCIDACRRGCEVIRNVRHKSLHSSDVLDSVLYKIADDPRSALTEADGASQKVIIECLNQCWEHEINRGRIRIVGEEEDDHSTDLEGDKSFDTAYSEDILSHFDNYNCQRPDVEPILRDLFGEETAEGSSKKKLVGVKGDEIIIFIDPMDGTREFVEGRIQNVQCLIGITLNGMPVAGAMGMPMVHENQIEIAYGLISSQRNDDDGVVETIPILSGVKFFDAINPLDTEKKSPHTDDSANDDIANTLIVFSGDSKKPALSLAMDCLENRVLGANSESPPVRKVVAGGCGNKMLSVQRHFQCISERHHTSSESSSVGSISIAPPGSSSWDTAAPTAVLLAVDPKARVSDLLGRPLIYDGDNLLNDCGVVVTSGYVASNIHERLCESLCKDEEFCEVIGIGSGAAQPKVNDDVIPTDIIGGESR